MDERTNSIMSEIVTDPSKRTKMEVSGATYLRYKLIHTEVIITNNT